MKGCRMTSRPPVCTQIEIIRGIERQAEVPMSIWLDLARHGHIDLSHARAHRAKRKHGRCPNDRASTLGWRATIQHGTRKPLERAGLQVCRPADWQAERFSRDYYDRRIGRLLKLPPGRGRVTFNYSGADRISISLSDHRVASESSCICFQRMAESCGNKELSILARFELSRWTRVFSSGWRNNDVGGGGESHKIDNRQVIGVVTRFEDLN